MILLRGGAHALEVLLVKRTPKARFMGGVWVFPGGAVDARRAPDDAAHRAAAVRELREEAAIELARPRRAREVLALDHARGGGGALRHPLLPCRAARRARSRRSTARSASTSAGSRRRARSPRTYAKRSRWCSPRSSISSSWRVHERRGAARLRRRPPGAPGPAAGVRSMARWHACCCPGSPDTSRDPTPPA